MSISQEAAADLSGAAPQDILAWALRNHSRGRVALCTSFQLEGMALLDMAWRIDPEVAVFTIDTGRLPAETLDLIDEVRERYGIRIEVLYPDATEVSELVSEHGVNLFYNSPELRLSCCEVRKVKPLNRKLATLDAWITGLRRDQNSTRATVAAVETDHAHGGITKINPLASWDAVQVDDYIKANNVPVNALYSQGYTSIGCAPCTRATAPGEDPRAGRWWWEQGTRECGLHYRLEVNEKGEITTVAGRATKEAVN